MRRNLRWALIVSFLVAGANSALAAPNCDGVLSQGIWRSESVSTSTIQSSDFANWMCSNSSSDAGFNLGYYGFGVGFTNQEAEAACSANQGHYYLQDEFKINRKVEAQGILDVWAWCMNSEGAHASIKFGQDPALFDIVISFFTPGRTRTTVSFSSTDQSVFDHCDKSKNDLLKGVEVVHTRTISCRRTDLSNEVHINYDFGRDGASEAALVVPKFVPRPVPTTTDFTGTYGVGALAGCADGKGFAAIYKQGKELWGRNECNQAMKIDLTADGKLVTLGIHGTYDRKLKAIFWDNNTQWINTDPGIPVLGQYRNVGPQCGSGRPSIPTIEYNSGGRLIALNECSQRTPLALHPDGSIEAPDHLVGVLSGSRTLNWSNKSVWVKVTQ